MFFVESVFILCYFLIFFSVDFSSFYVKNKMLKREFVKNFCGFVYGVEIDFLGDLYDNVYFEGYIVLKIIKCF